MALLGRLLANLLARSGDLGILAWIGESGPLPARVHHRILERTNNIAHPPAHFRPELDTVVAASYDSFNLDRALKLHDRLKALPMPKFAETRMRLPYIAFRLPALPAPCRTHAGRVYRVNTVAFGMRRLGIKTRHDLRQMKCLYLVYPWLDTHPTGTR